MEPTGSELSDWDHDLSLARLLEPETLENPFPLYRRIQSVDPIHWDIYMQAWVLTQYEDVALALKSFSAARTPTPGQLIEMGLSEFAPIAELTNKQMLFVDAPAHTRFRGAVATAFAAGNVAALRKRIREIALRLLADVLGRGEMDVVSEFADPLPGIITATMLGVPEADHLLLKEFAATFAETFGSFQHRADRTHAILSSCREMVNYFRNAIRQQQNTPIGGAIQLLAATETGGDRLTEDEVIANCIVIMVGGHETSSSAISGGIKTLLEHPEELARLKEEPQLIGSTTEEVLRYESPVQHTGRIAVVDTELGGKQISAGQPIITLIAAANRDPSRFPEPDWFNIRRSDNRHLAFGWGHHHCLGAPLARAEIQIALGLLARLPNLHLLTKRHPWQSHLGLRGLTSLRVGFAPSSLAAFDG